jgi:hypothetical protein
MTTSFEARRRSNWRFVKGTENPAKTNLKDWKWVGERDARPAAAEDGGATLL